MNLISFLLSSPAEALIQNSAELARTEFLAHRDELKLKLAELDNRLEVLQKQLTLSLKQFGLEATAELQLIYADVRDKQRIVSNTLRQMKPAHYEIDHLIKNKSRILQRILKECELWRAKEWKQVEKMTFRFFERINVFRDYRLQYMIVPEVRQFLPVTFLRDNDSLDGLHPSAAGVHAIAEAVCRKINENKSFYLSPYSSKCCSSQLLNSCTGGRPAI